MDNKTRPIWYAVYRRLTSERKTQTENKGLRKAFQAMDENTKKVGQQFLYQNDTLKTRDVIKDK